MEPPLWSRIYPSFTGGSNGQETRTTKRRANDLGSSREAHRQGLGTLGRGFEEILAAVGMERGNLEEVVDVKTAIIELTAKAKTLGAGFDVYTNEYGLDGLPELHINKK